MEDKVKKKKSKHSAGGSKPEKKKNTKPQLLQRSTSSHSDHDLAAGKRGMSDGSSQAPSTQILVGHPSTHNKHSQAHSGSVGKSLKHAAHGPGHPQVHPHPQALPIEHPEKEKGHPHHPAPDQRSKREARAGFRHERGRFIQTEQQRALAQNKPRKKRGHAKDKEKDHPAHADTKDPAFAVGSAETAISEMSRGSEVPKSKAHTGKHAASHKHPGHSSAGPIQHGLLHGSPGHGQFHKGHQKHHPASSEHLGSSKNKKSGKESRKQSRRPKGKEHHEDESDESISQSELGTSEYPVLSRSNIVIWENSLKSYNRIIPIEDEPFCLQNKDFPCNVTHKNETPLVKRLLRYDHRIEMPEYGHGSVEYPIGLEFLADVETMHCVLRQMNKKNGVCYKLFCQYDIYDKEQDTLIAFGLEKSSCVNVFCCLDFRYFHIRIYDYQGKLIMSCQRELTCASCCAKYFCCCCFCGGMGCGNLVRVFDGEDNFIGYIQQAPILAKRILKLAEMGDKDVEEAFRKDHTPDDVFDPDKIIRSELRIRKLNVFTAKNDCIARIEQYMEDSLISKFTCLDTFEQVGYVRKLGDDGIEIDVWRDFSGAEKALLIAAGFLVDHMTLGVSLNGSYYDEELMARREEDGSLMPRHRCYYICCLNRCRITLIICFIFVIVGLIGGIISFSILRPK